MFVMEIKVSNISSIFENNKNIDRGVEYDRY